MDTQSGRRLEEEIRTDSIRQDYEADREYIIQGVKDKLREKQYVEAGQLVDRYRKVAAGDTAFLALAKVCDEGREKLDKLLFLETELDALPKEANRRRVEIYRQIVDIDPDYKDYSQRLPSFSQDDNLIGYDGQAKSAADTKRVIAGSSLLILLMLVAPVNLGFLAMTFGEDSVFGVFTGLTMFVASCVVTFVIYRIMSNHPKNVFRDKSTAFKNLLSLIILFVGMFVCVCLGAIVGRIFGEL